jgi:hypothetical protein
MKKDGALEHKTQLPDEFIQSLEGLVKSMMSELAVYKTEPFLDVVQEFQNFIEPVVDLLKAYKAGEITEEEFLEQFLSMIKPPDFEGDPYYSTVVH